VQQIQLTNPGGNSATLTSLTLTETGTSPVGITSLSLVQNGTVISTTSFTGTTATFNISNVILPNGGTAIDQVVVNFSNGAQVGNYQFSVTGATGTNGQPLAFNGLPVNGAVVTIATASPTPSFTPSFTPSITPTFTKTITFTSTPTSTAQPANTPSIFPNPSNGTQPVTVAVTLGQPSDTLTVQVFTVAFRKVQDNVVSTTSPGVTASAATGTAAKTWYVRLTLNDKWGSPLASGLYYVVVSNHSGYRSVSKLLLLR
jgi:hypothetical protein